MNAFSKLKMFKATRLTQQGSLKKSLSLIRSMMQGSMNTVQKLQGLSTLKQAQPTRKTQTAPKSTPKTERRADIYERGMPLKKTAFKGKGSQFTEHSFSNQAGSRSYKLYIPAGYSSKAVPLVIMMHGCTQSPDDFAAGTQMNALADEMNFLVAYPAQPSSANQSRCWNWFNQKDQKRDTGEASIIAGITQDICNNLSVDKKRVYIAGLSAGGAAAAIMGDQYPDIYAAIGVHSGLASGAAGSIITAMGAMRQGSVSLNQNSQNGSSVPTIVFHGDKDTTVNPINAKQVITQFKGENNLKVVTKNGSSEGGSKFTVMSYTNSQNNSQLEHWELHGAGHAWSGGSSKGSYTDPKGPDASREMMRFFLSHTK